MTKAAAFHIVDLVTNDKNKKFEPAGRMAAMIIDLISKHGDCQPHDLPREIFTATEISEHWHMARAFADVEMKLMRA